MEHVLEAVKQSMLDPASKTVLLTGRTTLYEDRIKAIVSSAGIAFDYYGSCFFLLK